MREDIEQTLADHTESVLDEAIAALKQGVDSWSTTTVTPLQAAVVVAILQEVLNCKP